jgi:hypothetical protein
MTVREARRSLSEIVSTSIAAFAAAEQEPNLDRAFDLLSAKYYEAMPYPSLRGVETVLGFVEKDNPKAKNVDPKAFVDDSLLKEIDASGFVKGLYQR